MEAPLQGREDARAGSGVGAADIEAPIEEGGEITLGALPPDECAATAVDGSNCLAMLVRRDGERPNALLQRLNNAIDLAWSDDTFIDEVNYGESDLL